MDMLPHCFPNRLLTQARITGLATFVACLSLSLTWVSRVRAEVQIVVGTNTYRPFTPLAKPGDKVFIDASPSGKTPVHAMQRSLGYREVDYKALVFASLGFEPVAPKMAEAVEVFDYSAQVGMTNLIGYLTAKNVPILIGPDGEPYIADGHHTTAGYLSPLSPIRPIVPGVPRLLFGHIAVNAFNPAGGPRPVDDEWWQARVNENNAYLYGTNGNQLVTPEGANVVDFGPVAPSAQPMPSTPSALVAPNLIPMGHDLYRSLTWGMVDGITLTATDFSGKRIVGFNKRAPMGGEINFVEFCWADFMRNRIWWDDSQPGWPSGATNARGNAISAPISFFAAVANGIALARSDAYRDQFGRSLRDYAGATNLPGNTVAWATASLTNSALTVSNTFHLYWFDDSHVVGTVAPSSRSINILHINTGSGMVVSNQLENISAVYINEPGIIKTAWRDARIKNTTMKYPAAEGTVTLAEGATLNSSVYVGHGTFVPRGKVTRSVQVSAGTLSGPGNIGGSLTVGKDAAVVLESASDVLLVTEGIRLNGRIRLAIAKLNGLLVSSRMETPQSVFLKGTLVVTAGSGQFTDGDVFKLFQGANYHGAFGTYELPPLPPGLVWNTAQLAVDGTLSVRKE